MTFVVVSIVRSSFLGTLSYVVTSKAVTSLSFTVQLLHVASLPPILHLTLLFNAFRLYFVYGLFFTGKKSGKRKLNFSIPFSNNYQSSIHMIKSKLYIYNIVFTRLNIGLVVRKANIYHEASIDRYLWICYKQIVGGQWPPPLCKLCVSQTKRLKSHCLLISYLILFILQTSLTLNLVWQRCPLFYICHRIHLCSKYVPIYNVTRASAHKMLLAMLGTHLPLILNRFCFKIGEKSSSHGI